MRSSRRDLKGPSPADSMRRADRLLSGLQEQSIAEVRERCQLESELPDLLHALTDILRQDEFQGPHSYPALDAAYQLLYSLSWEDEFQERESLLASVSFLAWNCTRRYRTYPEMQAWESRVVEHVRMQTPANDFLALEPSRLSPGVLDRFLTDPPTLLASWQSIDVRANEAPDAVLKSSAVIWRWLVSNRSSIATDAETLAHIEGRLALLAARTSAHLGRGRGWEDWFTKARAALGSTKNPDPYLAMLEYNRLGRLHATRRYIEVEERIGHLIGRFRSLCMPAEELKAKFLRATSLKDSESAPSQAMVVLKDAYRDAVRAGNTILSASLASGIAQMYGRAGNPRLADCYANIGVRLAIRCACPWAEAYAISTWGELLRDRGEYQRAVEAYRAGARKYARAEMNPFVAYTQVIIAETLVLAGSEEEAMGELLCALPIIEREGLIEEAEASVWLMRQAIRRRGMSWAMLRELRERLIPTR